MPSVLGNTACISGLLRLFWKEADVELVFFFAKTVTGKTLGCDKVLSVRVFTVAHFNVES